MGWPGLAVLGCTLVSLHPLYHILSSHLVLCRYLPVRNSLAGVALGKVGAGVPADNGAVDALRREAEVSCPPPPKHYTPCTITQSYCLFNVTADPCEFDNLGRDSIGKVSFDVS